MMMKARRRQSGTSRGLPRRIQDGLRAASREFARDPAALAGVLVLAGLLLIAVVGPYIAPYPVDQIDLRARFTPPAWNSEGTWAHPLGTDALGRDMLSRLIYGARVSLSTGIIVVLFAGTFGIVLGLTAGYRGGAWESVIMRVVDTSMAFPGLLLGIAVLALIGPSQVTLIAVLSALGWMVFARNTHGVVLDLKERTFVKAAEVLGCGPRRIVVKHLLPNLASPLLTVATLEFARIILAEASLSYLGMGIQPPDASWGLMVAEGQEYISRAWWPVAMPGLAISVTVLAVNLVASWLRVISDPKQRDKQFVGLEKSTQSSGVQLSPLAANGREAESSAPLLAVKSLSVTFYTRYGRVYAVDDVSFDVESGRTLAIVGESGSGKSITAMSIMGLIPPPGRMGSGTIRWRGDDITAPGRVQAIRGSRLTMVFQDPIASLTPLVPVGRQIAEVLVRHKGMSRREAKEQAVEPLRLTGIPSPRERMAQYPFEFSGGMCQRVMLAIALAPEPDMIIADEPTTSLDVTIQAQILDLMADLQSRLKMAVILIAHDLGVVASMCDRIAVMYAGRLMEIGPASEVLKHPAHPYTVGLLASSPRLDQCRARLVPIPGTPPRVMEAMPGCPFEPRCSRAGQGCRGERPPLADAGSTRKVACWHVL
jgi:peptide/nickel transport system permease protein